MRYFQSKILIIELDNRVTTDFSSRDNEQAKQILNVKILNLNERFFYGLVNYVRIYKAFRRSLYQFFIELNSHSARNSVNNTSQSIQNSSRILPCDGVFVVAKKKRSPHKTSPTLILNITGLDPKDEIIRLWLNENFNLNKISHRFHFCFLK
jgi:hypothetical protein